jgi:AcrR family transcriptional regulator
VARPKDADSEATQQRIVDAAVKVFAGVGFDGATTRDLANAAGVNVNLLSHYFGNKQGLYDAVVDEVYRRLHARTQEAFAGALQIDAVIARAYDAARAERDGVRILVRQVLDGGRLTGHTEQTHFLPGLAATAELAAAFLKVDRERARNAAVTLGYLISRFVIQDDASLQAAFAVRSTNKAHEAVVATLITTTKALLGVAS